MTKDDIPLEWQDLLASIKQTSPYAIIAGGACRDWFLGQSPRDIDIFVPKDTFLDFSALGLEEVTGSWIESAEHDDSVSASALFDGKSLPVNIIWCSKNITPEERFKRFDFGICKISYDGELVIATNEFLWDVKHRIITLRRADNPAQTIESFKRYSRLKIKYPYDLIIPSNLSLPFDEAML